MKLDEKWLRAHLPEDIRNEDLNRFSGLYLAGLKVMAEGERGAPDQIFYEAKDEEDLKWWQLDRLCSFLGKTDQSGKWRWYRHHAENGQWYFVEHRHYDYNAIEDSRLPGFERYLRNVKYAFPDDFFRKKVKAYTALLNYWYLVPHWGYDYEKLRFIEVSDSREYANLKDRTEEIQPGSIVQVVE